MPEAGDYPEMERIIERGKQFYDCMAYLTNAFPNVYGFAIDGDHILLITMTPPNKEEQKQIREFLVKFGQCDADHSCCLEPDENRC